MNTLDNMELANAKKPKLLDVRVSSEGSERTHMTDDVEKPTKEELATLRRVPGKIPWIAYTVAFVELCERFSYYGTTVVCKFNFRL
jgi:POT family proton-dependent oligopeptide transporter